MFWWDDFWAVLALACFTTFVPGKRKFLRCLLCILLTSRQVSLLLPTVHRTRSTLVSRATTWVILSLAVEMFVRLYVDRSCWILLLHCLVRSSLHHLHRGAHCSVGFPEEDHVGRRICDFLPMGSLNGSDVLGL